MPFDRNTRKQDILNHKNNIKIIIYKKKMQAKKEQKKKKEVKY